MMNKKTKRVAICLITDKHDNILMGKRKDNEKWCCPAGHAYSKEDIYLAARRELTEETGLDPIELKLVSVEYHSKKKIMLYLFKVIIDESQVIDLTQDPDLEFSELKYLDPNDVLDQLTVDPHENIAIKYWANH
jgi:8-oxo-dGTP pyrophosphatase MutT (NUDIX family)